MDSGKATDKGQAPGTPLQSWFSLASWRNQNTSQTPIIQMQQVKVSSAAPEAQTQSYVQEKEKSCFIVYAQPPEGTLEEHEMKTWVGGLAEALEAQGWDVYSDQRDKPSIGHNIYDFNKRIQLENKHSVDMVLIIGTKLLLEKYRSNATKPPEVKQEIDWIHERLAVEDLLVRRKQLDIRRSIIPILYEAEEVVHLLPEFLCSQTERKLVHLRIKNPDDPLEQYASIITKVYSEDKSIIPAYRSLRELYEDQSKEEAKESQAIVNALAKLKTLKAIANKEVSSDYDETVAQGLSLYVPLDATDPDKIEKGTGKALEEEVNEFLALDKAKVFLLQGNSGAGKSLFGRYIEQQMWETYSPGKRIPLFISLTALPASTFVEKGGSPGKLIETILEYRGFSKEEIESIKTNQDPLFLILDGYDEANSKSNLYKQNHFELWNVKVLIACRSQYLSGDYRSLFTLPSTQTHQNKEHFLVERFIVPFTTNKVEKYIQQFADSEYNKGNTKEWGKDRYLRAFKSIPIGEDLVQEPFVLSTLLVSLPKLENSIKQQPHAVLKRSQIYAAFIEYYFEKEFARLGEEFLKLLDEKKRTKQFIVHLFEKYSCELAFAMLDKGTLVAMKPIATIGENDQVTPQGEWKEYFDDEKIDKKIGLNGSPLKSVGNGCYSFIHKSFLEYFVALKLHKIITKVESKNTDQEKREYLLSSECYLNLFLLHQKDPAVIEFLVEQIQGSPNHEALKKTLFKIIKLTKDNNKLGIAASNAITILNYAKVPITNQDFTDIHIPNAYLKGAIIENCNFSNANISNGNLAYAWIRNCKFDKTQDQGVITEEGIEFKKAKNLAISNNGQYTAVSMPDNSIEIWENKSRNIQSTLIETRPITNINFAEDNRHLITLVETEGQYKVCGWDLSSESIIWEQQLKECKIYTNPKAIIAYSAHKETLVAFNPFGRKIEFYSQNNEEAANDLVLKEKLKWGSHQAPIALTTNFLGTKFAWFTNNSISYCAFDSPAVKTLNLDKASHDITKIAFSQDDIYLAYGFNSGAIKLYNTNTEQHEQSLDGNELKVTALVFSPDSQWLIASYNNDTACVWDIKNKHLLATLNNIGNIRRWNAEDRSVALLLKKTIRLLPLELLPGYDKTANTSPITEISSLAPAGYFNVNSYLKNDNEVKQLVRKMHLLTGECVGVTAKPCRQEQVVRVLTQSYVKEKSREAMQKLSANLDGVQAESLSSEFSTISSVSFFGKKIISGHQDGSVKCWLYDSIDKQLLLQWRNPAYGWRIENSSLPSSGQSDNTELHDIKKFWGYITANDNKRVEEMLAPYKIMQQQSEQLHPLIKSFDENGQTPLQLAVQEKLPLITKVLLNHRAAQAKNREGDTILYSLLKKDDSEGLRLIFANGLNIEEADLHGQTALHIAVRDNRFNSLQILLNLKANLLAADSNGRRPIHYAAVSGEKEVLELLIKYKSDLNIATDEGRTALHYAITHGQEEIVLMLLENGASTQIHDKLGQTALHVAAAYGAWSLVLQLLKYGANPLVKENSNRTASAVAKDYFPTLAKFLAKVEEYAAGQEKLLQDDISTFEAITNFYSRIDILKSLIKKNEGNPSNQGCFYNAIALEMELVFGKDHADYKLNLKQAEESFKESIKSEIITNSTLVEYSNFLFKYLRYQEALRYAQQAIARGIDTSKLYYSNSEKLTVSKDLQNEIDFHQSISLEPYIFALYLSICTNKQLGNKQEAFKTIKMMQTTVEEQHDAIAFSLLGYAYMQLNLYKTAEKAFDKAMLTYKPNSTNNSYTLAKSNKQSCALFMQSRDSYASTKIANLWRSVEQKVRKRTTDSELFVLAQNVELCFDNEQNYDFRLKLYLTVFASYKWLYRGKDHTDVAISLANIALILKNKGEYTKALVYSNRELAMRKRLAEDKDHADVAICLNNIGLTLKAMGQSADALEYFKRALAMQERLAGGKDDAVVAGSSMVIGEILNTMGQSAEALEYFKRALAMRERLGHSYIAESYVSIGVTLHSLGSYQEALDAYDKALLIHEASETGQNKVNCAECLFWKAVSLTALDQLPAAIELLHVSYNLDPSANNIRCLAQAYALQAFKDPTKDEATQAADRYYKEALTVSDNALTHTYNAGFHYTQQRFSEAIEEWERALQSPKANEVIVPRILAIGSVIPCIQEEITFLRVFRSISHLLTHCSLVIAYQQQSNLPKAQSHLTQLTEAINTHEPAHTHYSLLGYAHKELGNTKEALAAFQKAYELYPTQPHAPEYTLAKKNMLEQEQLLLLSLKASNGATTASDPSAAPSSVTQISLVASSDIARE